MLVQLLGIGKDTIFHVYFICSSYIAEQRGPTEQSMIVIHVLQLLPTQLI